MICSDLRVQLEASAAVRRPVGNEPVSITTDGCGSPLDRPLIMLPETLQEESGVIALHTESFTIGEAREDRHEAFPSTVRAHTTRPFELVVQRRVGKIGIEQWSGQRQWEPRTVDRERQITGESNPFQVKELDIFVEPEVICGL